MSYHKIIRYVKHLEEKTCALSFMDKLNLKNTALQIKLFSKNNIFSLSLLNKGEFRIYSPIHSRYWYVDKQDKTLTGITDKDKASKFKFVLGHRGQIHKLCILYTNNRDLVCDTGEQGWHIYADPKGGIYVDGNNREWAQFYVFPMSRSSFNPNAKHVCFQTVFNHLNVNGHPGRHIWMNENGKMFSSGNNGEWAHFDIQFIEENETGLDCDYGDTFSFSNTTYSCCNPLTLLHSNVQIN
jgi:hypothetical protein